MAYQYQKNGITGKSEIVINGFEKGIADSPYQGITATGDMTTDQWVSGTNGVALLTVFNPTEINTNTGMLLNFI